MCVLRVNDIGSDMECAFWRAVLDRRSAQTRAWSSVLEVCTGLRRNAPRRSSCYFGGEGPRTGGETVYRQHCRTGISESIRRCAPHTAKGRVQAIRIALAAIASLCVMCVAWPSDDLYSLFGVDMPPGDIVILIDGSGSMGTNYPIVRRQVVDFVSSLTGSEQVCVYLFARDAGQALAGPGDEMARVADQRIPTETLPGEGTDIGLALHKGVQWLRRDGASATQALFLLTDGHHQPPPDSPFGSDYRTDPDWQQLRERGHKVARGGGLSVYGMGLSERTDIDLLRFVFPVEDTEIVVRSAADTGSLLGELRESLRRGRLQRAVERELEAYAVSVTTAPRDGALPALQLHNDYPHLPVALSELRVTDLRVSGGPAGAEPQVTVGATEEAQGAVIAPGSSVTLELHAEPAQNDEPPRLLDQERQYTVSCTVVPVLAFTADAGGLDLESPWTPKVAPVAVTGTLIEPVPGLWSRYWWAVALLGILVLIAWAICVRVRPERAVVGGELRYRIGDSGGQTTVQLDAYRKRTVTVGPGGEDVDVALGGLPAGSAVSFRIEAQGKWSVEAVSTSGAALHHRGRAVQTLSLKNGTRFRVEQVQFEYVNERLSREI